MTYFDAMKDLREMAKDHKKILQTEMKDWESNDHTTEDTLILAQICFKLDLMTEMMALMIKQNDHIVGNTNLIERNTYGEH